jgi:predicted Zn-dependent peptidase
VKDIQAAKVTPIAPRFVDFKKDLTFGQTEKNLPYIYVNNNENGRFQMSFYYPFGSEADVRYGYAGDYLDYLGTDSLTAQEVKQQFYKLACNYNIQEGDRSITVSLNGLSENMTEALALLEHLMKNAKVDNEAYAQFVAMEAKSRMDNKLDQRTNFNFLTRYAQYGAYNPSRHDMSIAELQQTNPQELLDLLKNLSTFEHTLLYYGPMSEKELAEAVTSAHQTPETLKTAPEGHHYVLQATPESTVTLAPYDAKNIYMMMYHNENRGWKAEEAPVTALFNEYFGGGMNTIVFQELREARGLAYSASAYYVEPTYEEMPEYFYTYIITQNDKMMDCVNQFHTILNEMPQSESAFNIAKESLTKKLASQRTTKFGLINAWLVAQRRGIDYDINQRIYEALPNLTMADVLRFANEQVANKAYNYIILGDEAELDMASLEKLGSIKRLTTEEIFGY